MKGKNETIKKEMRMKKNLGINGSIKLTRPRELILLTFLLTALFLFSSALSGNDGSEILARNPRKGIDPGQLTQQKDQSDVSSIDAIIKTVYESITFREGEKPDLDRFRSLFIANALFIRVTPDGVNKMDLDGFISSFSNRIDTGAMKSFSEFEISRKTHSYGSIAQVWSSYKKSINTEDPVSFGRGINSIQLFNDGKRWCITSIIWQDETNDNPIPEKYLHKKN
jgi:hypothetical protein